jgi:hypothetical protein
MEGEFNRRGQIGFHQSACWEHRIQLSARVRLGEDAGRSTTSRRV